MASAVRLGRPVEEEDDEEEQQERLLPRGPGGAGGAAEPPRSVKGGCCHRLVDAWRRPLGRASRAPAWLLDRLVFTNQEEEAMAVLRHLASVPYNAEEPTHERQLRRYFAAVRSPAEAKELPEGKDPRWKELGFQAEDPRTDFRGGGLWALQNLIFLAEAFPEHATQMLREAAPSDSGPGYGMCEYLFSAACINVSAMLVLLLGLNESASMSPVKDMPCPMHLTARKRFARLLVVELADSEQSIEARDIFGELFSSACLKLHSEWRMIVQQKPDATLLDFGEALRRTAVTLERLLGSLPAASTGGRAPAPGPRTIFSALDFIPSMNWYTSWQNGLASFWSAVYESLCRAANVLAEILDMVGAPRCMIWHPASKL